MCVEARLIVKPFSSVCALIWDGNVWPRTRARFFVKWGSLCVVPEYMVVEGAHVMGVSKKEKYIFLSGALPLVDCTGLFAQV